MRRSLGPVLVGLLLAFVAAAAVASMAGLPIAPQIDGEPGRWHFLRTLLPISAYALPGALAAIALSELRRVRGLPFFLFVGMLIAALGFLTLTGFAAPMRAALMTMPSFLKFMTMGLVAGFAYWGIAGKSAGHVAAYFARAADGSIGETDARKRCWKCAALGLLLGLLPLGLLGWYAIHRDTPKLAPAITAKAENDAQRLLADAGLPDVKLRIDNHVGHVTGTATDATARTAAFDKAKVALAPMVGLPGVVAYLDNDITTPDTLGSPQLVAEEKRKLDEAAAKAKAGEDARLAVETKRKAVEAEAKRKADEAEAKFKAEEVEAKRKVDEAEAKRKADEAEVKRKADAAEAKRKADEADAKRKADEAEAKRKADEAAAAAAKAEEDKRLAAEAEAERKAVDAARKATADAEAARKAAADAEAKRVAQAPPAAPAPAAAPPAVPPAPSAATLCAADFSDLFRSEMVLFDLNASDIRDESAAYLDKIAVLAARCGDVALTVDGHADRSGDDSINAELSKARADAVRTALIDRGIGADRLAVAGFGAGRPFDPANTREAYRQNRRVAFGTRPYVAKPASPDKAPAPAAAAPAVAPLVPLAPGLCQGEFSHLFLSDAIRFVGSSAELSDDHADFLDKIARLALQCPSYALYLDGHTDRRGNKAFNQNLSEDRANAVRDALIDRAVPESHLVARGYGGERPFDPGNTPEAYALNRRVGFGVAEKPAAKTP